MPRKKPPEMTHQEHGAKFTADRKSLNHECVTGQQRIVEADVAKICEQQRWKDTD